MHCSNLRKTNKNKGSSLVLPMATAVSCESPVIIFIDTPEAMSVVTASFTPVLGGSMIPTRPRNVSCPNSGPEAKARTWEIKSIKKMWITKISEFTVQNLEAITLLTQINHLGLECHCNNNRNFKNQKLWHVKILQFNGSWYGFNLLKIKRNKTTELFSRESRRGTNRNVFT